ncbi:5-histidylcysteine sulfoxide synthase [Catenovulum sp. SM1970]|uniref:5-histidylcysteine sulfoxide synthase n=1 Tax=Marinifaba aquimaris TaxID=2741323 RepID=UPI001573141B|nr:5-histidylcysteine sulfoxide synthase [Marinifaba aquimaris]NTS76557.1 5-histidylcysteine sulfoxide synthase [Marinifaba aquimaris]
MEYFEPTLKPPLLTGESIEQKRQQIKAYFHNSWTQYQSLFSNINNDDAFYKKAERLRHPLIFYFGHTATFFINKLILGKYIDKRIDPHLEAICAVGVDEMSWDDLDSKNYDWPAVDAVRAYRDKVYKLINQIIDDMPLLLPIQQDSLAWIILMGIEHERIHLETSSVIIRMLDTSDITEQAGWQACQDSAPAPKNSFVAITGKTLQQGKPQANATYGWDNEYGQKSMDVADFEASQYLVSNQEFLSFVEAGGYQKPQYWTEEGQAWLKSQQPNMPRFWSKRNGQYWQRNLTSEMPLPLNWPVEVNYLEAKAFCNWLAQTTGEFIRLPTEAEWQLLRDIQPLELANWNEAPGNINLEFFASSCPVNRFQVDGLFDVIGNVWQWTETPIDGFDGFKVHPLYDDFSTPTFDGKHNLIKGGSWISTGNEAQRDSRYAFRRHFFQHAGFRYIRSQTSELPVEPVVICETQADIANQLQDQYLSSGLNIAELKPLAKRVEHILKRVKPQATRALDLGCGVGRGTFELAKYFEHVDGIDFTARHIQHALAIKEQQTVRFATSIEGEILDYHEVNLAKLKFTSLADKVGFYQGDAHNLKPQFTGYDLIYADSLLEHLYDPRLCLSAIQQRLNPQGYLVLNSAYQWDESATEKAKWLGGIKVNGENLTGFDALQSILSTHFDLVTQEELLQSQGTNARCLSVQKSHLTVWRLKS